MSIPEKTLPINNFLPARLKENASGWVIEYYALQPQKQILQRKQVRIKRIESRYNSKREARAHCQKIVQTINAKLAGGWSPFFNTEFIQIFFTR